jgi:hypothetical protein
MRTGKGRENEPTLSGNDYSMRQKITLSESLLRAQAHLTYISQWYRLKPL